MDGIKSESYKLHNIKNSKIVDYRIWIDLSLFKFNMLKFDIQNNVIEFVIFKSESNWTSDPN